jgi:selenide,water dikinase
VTSADPAERVRLTAFASGGGCATKIGQADLLRLLGGWPDAGDPRVIVGSSTGDDAAVVCLDGGSCLVFTTDFFAPIVDDPDDYGAIAAANALSDVYAMGGAPLVALNLVAWPPEDVLPHSMLRRVLDAARAVVASAGACVVGGHSITDTEPKFGLAVIGTVDRAELMTNAAGRPDDVLLLGKPLGTGVVANALKRGEVDADVLKTATESMRRLNDRAAGVARAAGVRCATDVTGFGLLGHLHSLCLASGCAAEIVTSALPVLAGVHELIERNMVPGGTMRNLGFAAGWTEWHPDVARSLRIIAADAQTSGGLLLAAAPESAAAITAPGGSDLYSVVGRLVDGPPGTIRGLP